MYGAHPAAWPSQVHNQALRRLFALLQGWLRCMGQIGLMVVLLAALAPAPAQATIVYLGNTVGRNESLPNDGSAGAVTVPKPATAKPGDALIVSVAARPQSMTATAPAGWILLTFTDESGGGQGTAPGGMSLVTYLKIVGVGEPANYTWTFANPANAGGMAVAGLLHFSGIDTSTRNPIDGNGTVWSAKINPSGTTHGADSITTVSTNTMIISSITYLSSSNFGAPTGISGLVERIDQSAPVAAGAVGITMQMSNAPKASAGATGNMQATAAGTDDDFGVGHLMALKPSAIDSAITMSRGGPISPGGSVAYNMVVANEGLSTDPGPLTVVHTLPASLAFTSASGTGWVCNNSGQTTTCTRSGSLAVGASAATLTVNASVSGAAYGTVTSTATVSGMGGDANTDNNTAEDNYPIPTAPYAYYALDGSSFATVADNSGNGHAASVLGSAAPTGASVGSPPGPAVSGNPGTCGAANIPSGTTAIGINTGIDVNSLGNRGTISFWYAGNANWNNGTTRLLLDASNDLGGGDRHFFLSKDGAGALHFSLQDSAGTVSTAITPNYAYAANSWHHITVSWDIIASSLRIYLDGVLAGSASTALNGSLGDTATLYIGAQRMAGITGTPSGYTSNTSNGYIDEVRIYAGALSALEVESLMYYTHNCTAGVDHYELTLPTTGISCMPSTVTVTACSDSSSPCTNAATTLSGQTVTLSTSAGSLAATYLSFNASGVASTTLTHPTAVDGTSMAVTLSGEQSLATNARKCCPNGSACAAGSSCSISFNTAGLLFDVPNHRAEVSYSVSVAAVRKSNNAASCVPAFASVSKPINFKCSYTNPTTGTQAVRVGGSALNAANSATAACDGTGQSISLSFDASGVASTTVQYADAGRLALTATYTGSGSDVGVSFSGSDSFTAVPFDFAISGLPGGAIGAGSFFSGNVTARNYAGNVTPNFGRETSPESVTVGFVRSQPTGAGAVNGNFSGAVGAWSSGVSLSNNLLWTEAGSGNVTAALTSGSYLGSGQSVAGSSAGAAIWCANENGSCVLPTGATATVYYGALGKVTTLTGRSGTVACTSAAFGGDPYVGYGKMCQYVVTSGNHDWATAAALFKPDHFDVTVTPACGAFSYAGQPFAALVTARNASGATTLNYDGSAATNPNFAKTTTLSDGAGLGLGSLSGSSVAVSAFVAGVAAAAPAYSFTNKTTAAQTMVLRATDADSVSSAGRTEGSMPLRSGRLRVSNAFGSARAALQLAAVAEYWSANSWVLNSADNCTALAASSVVLSNPRNPSGAASAATSSASGLTLSNGSGLITLAAPSPAGSSLSLDLALNLGATTADQACNASHPASTGAAKPWLRAANGSCAATADRDPAARASFGIYSAESRKTVHVREIF